MPLYILSLFACDMVHSHQTQQLPVIGIYQKIKQIFQVWKGRKRSGVKIVNDSRYKISVKSDCICMLHDACVFQAGLCLWA